MHHFEITEHLICSPRKITSTDLMLSSEESVNSVNAEKKTDLWKMIARKHRIGIYRMSKKFLKKKISAEHVLVHKVHYRIATV